MTPVERVLVLVVGAFLALAIYSASGDPKASDKHAESAAAAAAADSEAASAAAAIAEKEQRRQEARRIELIEKARIGSIVLKDPKRPAADRLRALNDVVEAVPASAPELAKQRAALVAQIDRQEVAEKKRADAADRLRRRHEGVHIGMTKDEVLLSNWGHPDTVNKTISARGVHEQWVYEGGYLYFEDGTLTTIQN